MRGPARPAPRAAGAPQFAGRGPAGVSPSGESEPAVTGGNVRGVYVSALKATRYRNLDGTFGLCRPLSVVVGENNAGKSNLIDALRTVLEPEAGPRARCWVREEDFAHDGHGLRSAEELELEVWLADLDPAAQSRMVTCLAPKAGAGIAKLRVKATIGPTGRIQTQWFGGDSQQADLEYHAREGVRFVYLHPLRDAAADLRPGRENKLVPLLRTLAPPEHADHQAIIDAAQLANAALDQITTIVNARKLVAVRLNAMTGTGRFAQKSGLAFEDAKFERAVGALRAKIGQLAALEMEENGLGYNNLLYMAVLLAAIADAPPKDEEPTLRVLLVEEPEAHLHPQLQDLLMRFLDSQAAGATQVIVTTHSPSFAASARVERLTVIARDEHGTPVGRLPRDFGLEPKQLAYLRRFLDVTKASLFFARAVILVEGIAEQLLVPVIAERLGRPLAQNGVAVINIGGVAFPPFTDLFGPEKLPYRVAVVSDGDGQPSAEELEGEIEALSPRAEALKSRAGANIRVHLARRTLEWDLALAGNSKVMLTALAQVKPTAGPRLATEIAAAGAQERADAILEKVKDVKGRFAQELAELLADPKTPLTTPDYLRDAIEWVTDAPASDD
jgi:putative ATP-dependent endonuclease of the OLD family